MNSTIMWFRQDLRLADNAALDAAMAQGPVLPVYVLDDEAAGAWRTGRAQRWWLHHSLVALDAALRERGTPLLFLRGDAVALLAALAEVVGAGVVHASRLYEPWARERDAALALALGSRQLVLHSGALLHEPHRIRTGQGTPYTVYSPFARAIFALGDPPPPLAAPAALAPVPHAPGLEIDGLGLLPSRDWADAFPRHWVPGEAAAAARIGGFGQAELAGYADGRNIPSVAGTSGLSPHLHHGEASPRQVWHAARAAGAGGDHPWLKEIIWREFSSHLLWHRPMMPEQPLQPGFANFPFEPDAALLHAWQRGRTGYPIIDAGMRQLSVTGWMHNRVRMIVASFLVKHLLQPWQAGAAWFWDKLVDADLASNSASWQWVAGSGADAAPYFRVFNPILQGEKFDPAGAYVRTWLPALAAVPDRFIHQPWNAPVPPAGYPARIIDHAAGRARALAAYAAMRA